MFKGVHSSKDGQQNQDMLKKDGRKDDVIPSQIHAFIKKNNKPVSRHWKMWQGQLSMCINNMWTKERTLLRDAVPTTMHSIHFLVD
jgi:hypothetical protein